MKVMNDRIEALIIDFLNGTLSVEDKEEWHRLLDEGRISEAEIEEYQELFGNLDAIGNREPSPQMTDGFYTRLNEQINRTTRYTILDQLAGFFDQKGFSRGGLQAAYTLVVLVLGLGVGYLLIGRNDQSELSSLSNEVQEMKAIMMLSMLEKESPSDRIKAVSMTKKMAAVDDQVIEALFATLNNDQNNNVRLEALDALVRYAYQPKVRTKLIESLEKQVSPLVQLALADIMVLLQDKNAKRALEDLVNNDDTPDDIKSLIEERIKEINI